VFGGENLHATHLVVSIAVVIMAKQDLPHAARLFCCGFLLPFATSFYELCCRFRLYQMVDWVAAGMLDQGWDV